MQRDEQGARPFGRAWYGPLLLFALLVAAFGATPALAAGPGDYWTFEQYYKGHSEQRPWLEALKRSVDKDPVAISAKAQQKPVRIAQVYPGLQASSYWSDSEKALTGRLRDLGIAYELDTRYTSPNTQLDEQIRQIRELLDWQPDYLIYTLDSPRQKMLVERLIQNTDTRLILQNITTPLKDWEQRQPFMYVGFDHAEGASLLARYFTRRFPEADFGVLYRSKGLVSQLRGSGFIESLSGEHRLRSSYYSDSSRSGGKRAALRMLTEFPQLQYIYACSTDVALGTLDALMQLNRTDVMVNGWGGGPEEIEQLRAGRLPVVLMRMSDEAGIAIAEGIRRDLIGLPVPRVFSGRFVVLDDQMSDTEIRQQELRAHRYSGEADAR